MRPLRDEFLSEEDLDLRNLSDEELVAYWNQWLEQAQATNDSDAATYSHGVFVREPIPEQPRRVAEDHSVYRSTKQDRQRSAESG